MFEDWISDHGQLKPVPALGIGEPGGRLGRHLLEGHKN